MKFHKISRILLSITFILVLLVSFVLFHKLAFADSQGPKFPSTAVNDTSIGFTVWDVPNRATSSDNVYATNINNGASSHYIKATDFGFSIPAGATINGILVEWEVNNPDAGVNDVADFAARIVKGDVIGSTDRSNATNWPSTDTFLSHGSSSDLWGETWTPADINATAFGAALSEICSGCVPTFPEVKVDSVRITVTYTVANTAPSISAGPSDGGSSSTTPTGIGAAVAFTATATDAESNNYYLAICKTNSVTAVNSAAPTCGGGNWCISGSTVSGSQASCNYTALAADSSTNAWFAFVCDNSSNSKCSASSQGSGNNGSPFAVNHVPTFTAISNTAGSVAIGNDISFTSTASDSDASDTITLYICKGNNFTGTACGGDGQWCSSSASVSNPTCNYTVLSSDGTNTRTYYSYIIDNHNLASTSNPRSGTITFQGPTGGGGGGSPVTGIIVKKTTSGGDGTFNFTAAGPGYSNFSITTSGGSDFNVQSNLSPGTYSATEIVPLGWKKTADTCDKIVVTAGQVATCQVTNVASNPVPTITTIFPVSKTAGDADFTLTVNGTNFVPASIVKFNNSNKTTAYVSPTQLTAAIPASDVKTEGIFNVTVENPLPDGGTSNIVVFTVGATNPVPTITTISPVSVTAGSSQFVLTVNGTGFIPISAVKFGNSDMATAYTSSTKLTATIPASNVKTAGTYNVTVFNPTPGGGTSNIKTFAVLNPKPKGEIKKAVPRAVPPPLSAPPPISPPPPLNPTHNICNEQKQCILVDGEGADQCLEKDDCNAVANPQDNNGIRGIMAKLAEKLKETIRTPEGSVITKAISTIGILTGLAATASLLFSSYSFSEISLTIARLLGNTLIVLGIRKRILPWGTVYDSVTKQPLDPAYVILKDLHGKDIASAITDLDGRYGFLVQPGVYQMTAQKTNYAFPSQKLNGRTSDELHNDLYFGGQMEIKTTGGVITKNIPLDPVKFDWNEFAKKNRHFMKFYSRLDLVLRRIFDSIFVVGFAVAMAAFVFAPYPYNTIILFLYLFSLLLRLLGLKPKSFGYIIDKATGDPQSFAVIRVITASNVEISHKISDAYGRYYCLVPKGKYYLKVEKKNDDGSYSPAYASPLIDVSREGVIRRRLEV